MLRDHPRVCGKNDITSWEALFGLGSPPRVREKQGNFNLRCSFSGITPACAGKTLSAVVAYLVSRDHPRVCGKNCAVAEVE